MFAKFSRTKSGKVKATIENRHKLAPCKSKSKTFTSRSEAENWLADDVEKTMPILQMQFANTVGKPLGELFKQKEAIFSNSVDPLLNQASTLAEVMDVFLPHDAKKPKPMSRTAKSKVKALRNYNIAHISLALIEYSVLVSFCGERPEKCSPSTVRLDISCMARIIREAQKESLFSSEVLEGFSEKVISQYFTTLK